MSYIFNRLLIIVGVRSFSKWNNKYIPDNETEETGTIDDNRDIEDNRDINEVELTLEERTDNLIILNSPTNNTNLELDIDLNCENIRIELIKLDEEKIEDTVKEIEKESIIENNQYTLKILEIIYRLFLFIVIFYYPVTNIIYIVKTNYVCIPPSIIFEMLIPIQYFLSLIYFSRTHFDSFYLNDSNSKLIICIPSVKYLITGILTIVSISTIVSIILKISNNGVFNQLDPLNYSNQPIMIKILILVFDLLQWFYGRSIILINLSSFTIVFCKHVKIIEGILEILNNKVYNRCDMKQLSFICKQVTRMRHELHISIKYMESMFSTSTIIGAVALGYIFETRGKYSISEIPLVSIIIFVFSQIVFFYIVYRVSNQKEELHKLINSPRIVKLFLSRLNKQEFDLYNNSNYEEDNHSEEYINTITKIQQMMSIERENATSIDWLILNNVLNQQWTEFSVFGITLQDGNVLKKCVVMGTLFILLLKNLS